MKQKGIEIVKCHSLDGSHSIKFRDNKGRINSYNDMSGAICNESQFTKVEPLEQPDTLQEVVDWSRDEECKVVIDLHDVCFHYRNGDKIEMPFNMALQHIRKPKLKQITPEELAEMGYELLNK